MANVDQSKVDMALQLVAACRESGLDHILCDAAKTLADEVLRYREFERQRWETAKRWYISSMASSRGQLGLPPRVPVIREE